MFRKTRIRKRILVAGLGLAALAAPTAALGGGQDSLQQYGRLSPNAIPYLHAASAQSQGVLLDGRSPDTKDAAISAHTSSSVPQYGQIPYGAPDGWTPYAFAVTAKSRSSVVDGRSPDTRDFATLAHSPVVTITRPPGFQWGDFGIGTGVALAAVILLALSLRFMSNRQDRKPGSVATA